MLFGHPPHTLKPGDNVLVWGASGGLGVFGVQLVAASGANAIGIVSDQSKVQYVMDLGAKGVINRSDFKCWGAMPKVGTPEYDTWVKEARRFGKAIWDITGKRDVDIVFEHPGEATFPVSCLVVKRGGMVVFCAGTSGYNITFDARYVWMRQKRVQGSHFAHLKQASAANQFVIDRRVDPCMSDVFPWEKIPYAHELMRTNRNKPGNMAVLVNTPRPGLRNFEDVLEAQGGDGAILRARLLDPCVGCVARSRSIKLAAIDENPRDEIEKHQRHHRRCKSRIIGHVGVGKIRKITAEYEAAGEPQRERGDNARPDFRRCCRRPAGSHMCRINSATVSTKVATLKRAML